MGDYVERKRMASNESTLGLAQRGVLKHQLDIFAASDALESAETAAALTALRIT
jgi:hypothetical protein